MLPKNHHSGSERVQTFFTNCVVKLQNFREDRICFIKIIVENNYEVVLINLLNFFLEPS